MADDLILIWLLREYAGEGTITRPEVGKITGKTVGQLAGVHHRNPKLIGDWPKVSAERKENRRCQFPIGTPGYKEFHLCGKDRAPGDPLVCEEHRGKIWNPDAPN